MITDPLAVFLILAAVVLAAVVLEERFAFFRSLGSALVGILLAMVLSNVGVLPGESSAYDFLMGRGVSIGIALILLSVDVRSVFQAGPRMLAAFGLGAVGTALGATVGALMLVRQVGPETWKLAGQYTGTYTGGGANFAAIGRDLGTSSDVFSAATAADVIVTAIWMATCLTVPLLLGYKPRAAEAPSSDSPGSEQPFTLERALHTTGTPVPLRDAAALITIAMATVWFSEWLGSIFPVYPVLWLTTIVLLIAQVPAVKALAGSALWGNYLVLLFLASNGARSVVANIVTIGPAVFYYAIVTVAIHGAAIFGLGRVLRLDAPTLMVASQANVGGAASAMALASARGYGELVLPGVAVGMLGYAIGNYIGFGVATLVRSLVGG